MAEKELPRIIVLEPTTDSVRELLRIIGEKGQAELMPVTTGEEAAQLANQYMPCMLVVCVIEGADIPNRVTLLKKVEKGIKKGQLKTLFVSKLKNRQLGQLISSLGVTDYMEEPVPVRTMQFKANLQLKAVETIRKQEALKKASEEKIVFKPSEKKKEDNASVKTHESGAKLKPALNVSEDTFLFKTSQVKKNGKKVMVELDGPAPETGEWVPHEDKGDAKNSWRWVPEDKKDEPETKNGDGWVHSGDKPTYNPETKKWQMSSEKPELALQKEGKKIATKISTDENGELEVAEDSPAAEENLKKNEAVVEKKKAAKAEEQKLIQAKKESEQLARKQEFKATAAANAEANKEAKEKKVAEKEQTKKLEKEVKATADKEAAEADSVAAFNNKTGGEKDSLSEFNNRLKGIEASAEVAPENATVEASAIDPEIVGKKAPINPLEFLKKKKEQAQKAAGENTVGANEFNNRSEQGPGAVQTELRDKRSGADKNAKLNQFKNMLGESIEDSPEFNGLEENSKIEASSNADPLEEAMAESQSTENSKAPAQIKTLAMQKARAEKRAAERKEKAARLQTARKVIQKEIQTEVNAPLPDTLAPEVETELREKFGLVERKEVTPKDLARKAKLEKLKNLKGKLAELDIEKLEDESNPETSVHDLKEDEIDNTWSQGEAAGGARAHTKIRAFDSELSEEEKEEAKRKKLETAKLEATKKGLRSENSFHYLPEAEIQPLGGAWEATGENYVYLSGEIKYHGFETLKDILPLWIFQGTGVPELMDKSHEWKFNDAIPFMAKDVADIPDEVKEYLLGLRDQIKDEKSKPEEESDSNEFEKEESLDGDLSGQSSKKLKRKDSFDDKLEALKSSLDEELETNGEDFSSEKNKEEPESEEGDDELAQERKRLKEEKELAIEKERKEALARGEDPFAADSEKKKDRKEELFKSKLDMLKAGLEESENTLHEDEIKRDENDEPNSESLEKVRAERNREDGSVEGIAEKVTGKLSKDSEAIHKFLERRKHKEATVDAAPTERVNSNPYLGIFVALSDAVNPGTNTRRSVLRTLRAVEGSIENSIVLVTDADRNGGESTIRFSNQPDFIEGKKVSLENGFVYPIANSLDAAGLELGYLYVQALPPKSGFDTIQVDTLKKVALLIWPILAKEEEQKKNEKLAA